MKFAIQVSGALKCSQYSLNVSARNGTLGIRHMFCGRNLRIFRGDLLSACGVAERGKDEKRDERE